MQILSFTIWESLLQCLHGKSEFATDHAKEINYALFVSWRMTEATEIYRFPK